MTDSMPAQDKQKRVHLTGINGSGMRAMAELLVDEGWQVTGSDAALPDAAIDHFRSLGVRAVAGEAARHVDSHTQWLIHSAAVPEDNAERLEASRRGIEQISYPQMLGRLMTGRTGISIAGTHGKSTTTALLGHLLQSANASAGVLCGAELYGTGRSGWSTNSGESGILVVESCEYRRHFLHLSPQIVVMLNIEPDHFDCFPNLTDAVTAYRRFVGSVPENGLVLFNGDDPLVRNVAESSGRRTISFGCSSDSDWRIEQWTAAPCGSEFLIRIRRQTAPFAVYTHSADSMLVRLPLRGRHNALNATAALCAAAHLQIPAFAARKAAESLGDFGGLRRRFEHVGTWGGVRWIDDYAHHPTAVAATLRAARELRPTGRLWCVFEPHQVSRTEALLHEFAASLSEADEVMIAPIFQARETASAEAEHLAQRLANLTRLSGTQTRFEPTLDRILASLETETLPGDLVVTMGAGHIDQVYHEFSRRLQRDRAS